MQIDGKPSKHFFRAFFQLKESTKKLSELNNLKQQSVKLRAQSGRAVEWLDELEDFNEKIGEEFEKIFL